MKIEDTTKPTESWEVLRKKFSEEVGDKLGMGIDEGAIEPVVGLNALGFETSGSCEGHLERGAHAPYLDVRSKESELFQSKIDHFWEELGITDPEEQRGDRISPEKWSQLEALMEENESLIEEKNVPIVRKLLDEFHESYPRGNFTAEAGPEWVRIEPADVEERYERTAEEQEKFLKIYQQELAAFGTFLKRKHQAI